MPNPSHLLRIKWIPCPWGIDPSIACKCWVGSAPCGRTSCTTWRQERNEFSAAARRFLLPLAKKTINRLDDVEDLLQDVLCLFFEEAETSNLSPDRPKAVIHYLQKCVFFMALNANKGSWNRKRSSLNTANYSRMRGNPGFSQPDALRGDRRWNSVSDCEREQNSWSILSTATKNPMDVLEDTCVSEYVAAQVVTCCKTLTEQHIFLLCCMGRVKCSIAARELGLPEETVRATAKMLRERFRRRVKENLSPPLFQ